jgi:hypothetical protein
MAWTPLMAKIGPVYMFSDTERFLCKSGSTGELFSREDGIRLLGSTPNYSLQRCAVIGRCVSYPAHHVQQILH